MKAIEMEGHISDDGWLTEFFGKGYESDLLKMPEVRTLILEQKPEVRISDEHFSKLKDVLKSKDPEGKALEATLVLTEILRSSTQDDAHDLESYLTSDKRRMIQGYAFEGLVEIRDDILYNQCHGIQNSGCAAGFFDVCRSMVNRESTYRLLE